MRTRDRKSICTSFGRDRPAKALRPESRGPGGQDARRWIQAKKISSTKAFLIVILISPSSLKNVQMQMFCTSLEPNTKQWQGTDLSIMTAIKITNPGTKSPLVFAASHTQILHVARLQPSIACWAAQFRQIASVI